MTDSLERKISSSLASRKSFSVHDAYGSLKSLLVSKIFGFENRNTLVICETDHKAEEFYKELKFFSKDSPSVLYLPDSETLPYDQESPHSGLTSIRARVFNKLSNDNEKEFVIVTSVSNVLRKTSRISHWRDIQIDIDCQQKISFDSLKEELLKMGYIENPQETSILGEFTIKNDIFDIFPLGMDKPVRIRKILEKVTKIQEYNPISQRSTSELESVKILSAKEMPVDETAIDSFRIMYRRNFKRVIGDAVYEGVMSGNFPLGIEYYLPLFQEETSTIFDYLSGDVNIVSIGSIDESIDKNIEQINQRFKDLSNDNTRKVLNPEMLWISKEEFNDKANSTVNIQISEEQLNSSFSIECRRNDVQRLAGLSDTVEQVEDWIDEYGKVVFCLHSDVRRTQLETICEMADYDLDFCESWSEALESSESAVALIAPVDKGFISDDNLMVVSEREMFGQAIFAKMELDDQEYAVDYQSMQDLKNIASGEPIVHFKNGVGRVDGLSVTPIQGVDREYLLVKFDKESTIFVPMDELDMVSRYGGINTENTPLHEAASDKWIKGLNKAMKDIESTAHALISIEESRQKEKGIQLKKPKFEFQKFCNEFPFQETRDQKTAVSDIVSDLIKPQPMNRTIVGDVGFGKTEVAMRAAFVAASQGYQVAVMVPTTLLAMQHFESFKKRFESFGINIDCLSQKDSKDSKEVVRKIKSGEAGIVIGTHKIIQKDVVFKNIGLMIVDEEHRFGVAHKNKIKDFKGKVNLLFMTATPIPRTLSMSLHGVRDLSIIATPPAKRLSIRTIVSKREDSVVSEAIQREMMRDGQIFVLHNSIETIEQRAEEIRSLIPGIRVGVGHGRMSEAQLESVMSDFYKKKYDLLVCTTIIETGIDVPNANTILIEKSDRFGIAQLHQLRGRVGRSNHQAYAYLMLDDKPVSESAMKRLKAMEKATKLGEGFVLANHDLEIRGAGELLGDEQSGHIQNIGFTLYMRLLNRAITMLKEGKDIDSLYQSTSEVKVDLGISALIDSDYIQNQQIRLSLYKRFSSVQKISEIDNIKEELEDKFGSIPENTKNIINVSKLRCYLKQLDITKLSMNQEQGVIVFSEHSAINTDRILDLIDEDNSKYSMTGPYSFSFKHDTPKSEDRFKLVVSLVTSLAEKSD